MTSISHLHREFGMLSVPLFTQHASNTWPELSAWNISCTQLPGSPRRTGNSAASVCLCVRHRLSDCNFPTDQHRSALRSLHKCHGCSHAGFIRTLSPFSESQSLLIRPARVALSQLRSGFCLSLMDYQARIGAADSVFCSDAYIAITHTFYGGVQSQHHREHHLLNRSLCGLLLCLSSALQWANRMKMF